MKTIGTVLQALGAIVLSVFGLRLTSASSPPVADFLISPSNPAAGRGALFIDSSANSPTQWSWDFGDGGGSTEHNPTHVYASPGNYVATLRATNSHGSTSKSRDVVVSAGDTLRLNVAGQHPFAATIQARNQRTGETGPGFAIPQTDIFGYFSLPALTRNPDNPEIFVKIIDGNFLNGQFWVFYGGLTDLEYTLTVQDELTGATRSYLKPAGSTEGGFDTSAFPGAPAGSTSAWLASQSIAFSRFAGVASFVPQAPDLSALDIESVPINGVVDQQLLMTIPGLPSGLHELLWTLEPGVTTTDLRPVHAFSVPGDHHVTAFDRIGSESYGGTVTVSPPDVLWLLPTADRMQDYYVQLTARDPRTDRIATGQAFANSPLFGSFSLPGFTGNRNNAEVIVKMLDGRGVNNAIWSFYGGLTDVQWTMGIKFEFGDLSISKFYFKNSYSKLGGFDTSGFDAAKQPTIQSISPLTGSFGTTIRILGTHLYGDLIEHFFDDSIGHLKNEKFPLQYLRGGIDLGTGLDFLEVQPTNPTGIVLPGSLTSPISVVVDHYLVTGPQPFILVPLIGTPTITPVPSATPTSPPPSPTPPGPTHTPPPTAPPTATQTPLPGGPVVQSTSTDDVNDGSTFDIFGMNFGACNVIAATFEGTPGTFALICQFGDPESVQVQVPTGGVIPIGSYNVCITRKGMKGCSSFQMRKH